MPPGRVSVASIRRHESQAAPTSRSPCRPSRASGTGPSPVRRTAWTLRTSGPRLARASLGPGADDYGSALNRASESPTSARPASANRSIACRMEAGSGTLRARLELPDSADRCPRWRNARRGNARRLGAHLALTPEEAARGRSIPSSAASVPVTRSSRRTARSKRFPDLRPASPYHAGKLSRSSKTLPVPPRCPCRSGSRHDLPAGE